jgi:hypothetical protein
MMAWTIISGTEYELIPPRLINALYAYGDEGRPTGDFLRAVLENDLRTAIGLGDSESLAVLPIICRFVYNEMPAKCHGSPEVVATWLEENADYLLDDDWLAEDEEEPAKAAG